VWAPPGYSSASNRISGTGWSYASAPSAATAESVHQWAAMRGTGEIERSNSRRGYGMEYEYW
jgi:hypothetical protein